MTDCSAGWITGGMWIGLLMGVVAMGTLIIMLTSGYRTVVTIARERDFPGQEET